MNAKGVLFMKKYERPIVIANSELSEGVYAASGGAYASALCQSSSRNGVFDSNLCIGCPAFNNNGCNIENNYKPNNDYRPQWERNDKDPSGNNGIGNGGGNGKGHK